MEDFVPKSNVRFMTSMKSSSDPKAPGQALELVLAVTTFHISPSLSVGNTTGKKEGRG